MKYIMNLLLIVMLVTVLSGCASGGLPSTSTYSKPGAYAAASRTSLDGEETQRFLANANRLLRQEYGFNTTNRAPNFLISSIGSVTSTENTYDPLFDLDQEHVLDAKLSKLFRNTRVATVVQPNGCPTINEPRRLFAISSIIRGYDERIEEHIWNTNPWYSGTQSEVEAAQGSSLTVHRFVVHTKIMDCFTRVRVSSQEMEVNVVEGITDRSVFALNEHLGVAWISQSRQGAGFNRSAEKALAVITTSAVLEAIGYDPTLVLGLFSLSIKFSAPQECAPAGYSQDYRERMQMKLREAGLYPGTIDGVVGSGTKRAIRMYKLHSDSTVNGCVDSQLMAALGIDSNLSPHSQKGQWYGEEVVVKLPRKPKNHYFKRRDKRHFKCSRSSAKVSCNFVLSGDGNPTAVEYYLTKALRKATGGSPATAVCENRNNEVSCKLVGYAIAQKLNVTILRAELYS